MSLSNCEREWLDHYEALPPFLAGLVDDTVSKVQASVRDAGMRSATDPARSGRLIAAVTRYVIESAAAV